MPPHNFGVLGFWGFGVLGFWWVLEKNPFPGFDPKIFAPRKKEQIFRKNPPAAALAFT